MYDINKLQNIYKFRTKFLRTIREFFWLNNFLEIDTPILNPYFSQDLNIEPFNIRYENKKFFLATSPEFGLKRVLTTGIGDIFEISHSFRKDPLTDLHNPEFLLLEWYRIGKNYLDLIKDLKSLISFLFDRLHIQDEYFRNTWKVMTLKDAFLEYSKINLCDLFSKNKRINIAISKNIPDEDFNTVFFKIHYRNRTKSWYKCPNCSL